MKRIKENSKKLLENRLKKDDNNFNNKGFHHNILTFHQKFGLKFITTITIR